MKSIVVILLVALLVPTVMFAAAPKIGVKAGVNLANASFDPKDQYVQKGYSQKMRVGIMGGITGEMALTPKEDMSVKLDLLYVQKGVKVNGSGTEDDGSFTYTWDDKRTAMVDEFCVAPFFVYSFKAQQFRPFLQIGPELGFNMKHKSKDKYSASGGGLSMSKDTTEDIKDWASTDFSLNIGGGVAMAVGKGEVVLDLRYNLGLTDMDTHKLTPDEVADQEKEGKVKLNGIQLTLGYNFTLPVGK
jgi:hypothetical protein